MRLWRLTTTKRRKQFDQSEIALHRLTFQSDLSENPAKSQFVK